MSTSRQNPNRSPDLSRCHLTGVRFSMNDGFVLNRRAANDLAAELTDRLVKLRRIIDQLGPLDDAPRADQYQHVARKGGTQKRHRLICKAVAEALSTGYPEIDMFMRWPDYRAHARALTLSARRRDAARGQTPEAAGDEDLLRADGTARNVLNILDPTQTLPISTRHGIAIAIALCPSCRDLDARELAHVVREAAAGPGEARKRLGLRATHLEELRGILTAVASSASGPRGDDQSSEAR